MEFNKKAISPVVATALLLVVAVVAVVGFQTWFTTFQSKSFVDIEQQTDTGASVTISRVGVVGSSLELLVLNSGSSDVNPSKITLTQGSNSCDMDNTANFTKETVTTILNASSGCVVGDFTSGQPVEVVIVTDSSVVSGSQIVR